MHGRQQAHGLTKQLLLLFIEYACLASFFDGGEQALVAISIYFAILAVNPAPFCILDEIEAALDDANVVRFAQYLRQVSDKTQFIVITHRRGTMEAANVPCLDVAGTYLSMISQLTVYRSTKAL